MANDVIDLIKPGALAPRGAWAARTDDIWAMICASRDGDLATVRTLLARDPRLAGRDYFYAQPIHFAVREGRLEVVRVLVEAGADVTYRSPEQETLRTIALDRGHLDVAAYLEEAMPARLASARADHEIHHAVAHGDLERVRALVSADPTLADRLNGGGFRPIDLALWENADWDQRNDETIARELLARGAAYTITIAAALGDEARTRELLAGDRARANEPEPCGKRPISAAAERGHLGIARLLLEHGADPNLPEGPNHPRGYALYAASRRSDMEMARILLAAGADPNADPDSGGQPASASDPAMRALMYRHGGRVEPNLYVWEGNLDAVAALLEGAPAYFDAEQPGGGTPYSSAVTRGDWNMLHLLLSRGVRVPDVVTLCQSYLWERLDMTRVLLERGMNPNLTTWQRATPLHVIARGPWRGAPQHTPMEAAALFLEFGADLHARDEEYRSTPLAWAARAGHHAMAEFLLARGARTHLPDDEPWATPLAWAEKRGHDAIAALMRVHGATR